MLQTEVQSWQFVKEIEHRSKGQIRIEQKTWWLTDKEAAARSESASPPRLAFEKSTHYVSDHFGITINVKLR